LRGGGGGAAARAAGERGWSVRLPHWPGRAPALCNAWLKPGALPARHTHQRRVRVPEAPVGVCVVGVDLQGLLQLAVGLHGGGRGMRHTRLPRMSSAVDAAAGSRWGHRRSEAQPPLAPARSSLWTRIPACSGRAPAGRLPIAPAPAQQRATRRIGPTLRARSWRALLPLPTCALLLDWNSISALRRASSNSCSLCTHDGSRLSSCVRGSPCRCSAREAGPLRVAHHLGRVPGSARGELVCGPAAGSGRNRCGCGWRGSRSSRLCNRPSLHCDAGYGAARWVQSMIGARVSQHRRSTAIRSVPA
jgi:hypothetical protein